MIWVSRIDLFSVSAPNGNKKTIALPYRFRIEKTAQIFLSESGRCQAIVSLFRNYRLSGIKMYSNFCIKIRVQICLRTIILIQCTLLKPKCTQNKVIVFLSFAYNYIIFMLFSQ